MTSGSPDVPARVHLQQRQNRDICLGCTIEVKGIGKRKLKERTDLARFCIHLKGEIDLRSSLAVI